MNSPEVFANNMLFEGPDGLILRQLTHVNGATHLYTVDEYTGKQTPIAHQTLYDLQNKHDARAETPDKPLQPYMLGMLPNADPASIAAVIRPEQSRAVPIVENVSETKLASTIDRPISIKTYTYTAQPKEVEPFRPLNGHVVGAPDVVLPVAVGMAWLSRRVAPQDSATKGVRTEAMPALMKLMTSEESAAAQSDDRVIQSHVVHSKKKEPKREKKPVRVFALASLALLGSLLLFNSCDDDEKDTSPRPGASTSVPAPAPSTTGPTEVETPPPDVEVPLVMPEDYELDTPADKQQAFSLLKPGETVWQTAHNLLKLRGYYHNDDNTIAIKDAMLQQMGIAEAEARRLAVNTKVPLFDDDDIDDILDNFSNTKPHKIK